VVPQTKVVPHFIPAENFEMETRSIAFNIPITAIHPQSGKPVKIVGITDEETTNPKLVLLVTGPDGKRAEVVEWVENERR
jgi:hypothetical protein